MSNISNRPDNVPQSKERRTAFRRRAYMHGKIISWDGALSLDCVLRNLSDSGAKIQVPDHELFPVKFYLLCTVLKRTFDAEMAWRKNGSAGLEFHAVYNMTATISPALQVVKKFFSEHAPRSSPGL
jgi:hypothetical protein